MIDGRPHISNEPLRLEHSDGSWVEIYYFDANRVNPRLILMESGRGDTFRATIAHSASSADRAEMAAVVASFCQNFEQVGFEALQTLTPYSLRESSLPQIHEREISSDDFQAKVVEVLKPVIPAELSDETYCILLDEVNETYQNGFLSLKNLQSLAQRVVTCSPFVGDGIEALHYAEFVEELSAIARNIFELPESYSILDSAAN